MARALGYRLCETGIVWTDREGSRVRMGRILVPVVRELRAARRHVRREARSGPAAAQEQRGPGDLRTLISGPSTWEVAEGATN